MDLRNTKIDLRRPDGSIDKEKSAAFLQLATGEDYSKRKGSADYLIRNAPFLLICCNGDVDYLGDNDENYFVDFLDDYREVICEPEYFIAFKQSDEELARDSKIAELSAQLKQIQAELAALKSGVK